MVLPGVLYLNSVVNLSWALTYCLKFSDRVFLTLALIMSKLSFVCFLQTELDVLLPFHFFPMF